MGASKTATRFLEQNSEQRWVISPGGGGMEDNESPFRQADEQSFHASVTQRVPQGWCGSWSTLLAISMAARPMPPTPSCVLRSLQKIASAVFQGHQGLQEALRLLTSPTTTLYQDTHRWTQELTRYPCGGESHVSVQLGHGTQVFGQTLFCLCL